MRTIEQTEESLKASVNDYAAKSDYSLSYFLCGVTFAQNGVEAGYEALVAMAERGPFEALVILYDIASSLEGSGMQPEITTKSVVEFAMQDRFNFIAW